LAAENVIKYPALFHNIFPQASKYYKRKFQIYSAIWT